MDGQNKTKQNTPHHKTHPTPSISKPFRDHSLIRNPLRRIHASASPRFLPPPPPLLSPFNQSQSFTTVRRHRHVAPECRCDCCCFLARPQVKVTTRRPHPTNPICHELPNVTPRPVYYHTHPLTHAHKLKLGACWSWLLFAHGGVIWEIKNEEKTVASRGKTTMPVYTEVLTRTHINLHVLSSSHFKPSILWGGVGLVRNVKKARVVYISERLTRSPLGYSNNHVASFDDSEKKLNLILI